MSGVSRTYWRIFSPRFCRSHRVLGKGDSVKELNSIRKYQDQSTWRLFGLGVITYSVYFAHYIKKQTIKINEATDAKDNISMVFINAILIMSYVSLGLFFAYMVVEVGHPVEAVSNIFNLAGEIMLIVWGFMARNRLNALYVISKDDNEWFHGLWTFLFSPLYFNYKINRICEESVEQVASLDA